MQFEEELARVLPQDLPNRERLLSLGQKHLEMISAANEYMNLTRIVSPQEAAIKHIYDCVAPWRHFQSANRVLDVGTGAGFPGYRWPSSCRRCALRLQSRSARKHGLSNRLLTL